MHDLPLLTRSLRLRHFTPADAPRVCALSQEACGRAWLPSQVYRDAAHALAVIEFLVTQYQSPGHPARGPYVLAVEQRTDQALIGHVGFSPLGAQVEIGFAVAQDRQRHGLATEAIVSASAWAFRVFTLERILGVTAVANVASQRTLARAGFVHERDVTMAFQGTRQPVLLYALLRSTSAKTAGGAPEPSAAAPCPYQESV